MLTWFYIFSNITGTYLKIEKQDNLLRIIEKYLIYNE